MKKDYTHSGFIHRIKESITNESANAISLKPPQWSRLLFLTVIMFLSTLLTSASINDNHTDKNICDVYHTDINLLTDGYFIDSSVKGIQAFINQSDTDFQNTFQLFSHGKPGELFIEDEWKNAQQIAKWLSTRSHIPFTHSSIHPFTHLNIYGCEFAKGKKGKSAVSYLEMALGISIAASDDITGIDGDWELEIGMPCNSIQLTSYPDNLQDCSQVDPNALVNTYPQVFTCGADDVNDFVIGMSDATSLSYNSNTQTPNKFSNSGWTLANVGNIYYTEFDAAGCLYAPASQFTQNNDINGALQQYGSLGGADAIYKMDAVTGAPTVWTTISTSGQGFGGITYDHVTNTIYVVNMGDGSIYQLDMAGNILDVFQPILGTSSYQNIFYSNVRWTNFQARPFGLDINPVDGKLYYTVIDGTSGGSLVVRSVDRLACGEMIDNTDIEEINQPLVFDEGQVEQGNPVVADIDFNANGDMAVGSFSNVFSEIFYITENGAGLYNHLGYNYIFTGATGSYTQTAMTSVGQEPYIWPFTGPYPNGTSTGGVAWDPNNPDVLWMSGGDFNGEDGTFGIIGYNVNQLDNVFTQEDATNYIQFLFEPQTASPDPKGNGGDVDVFTCPLCTQPDPPVVSVDDSQCPASTGNFIVVTDCGPGTHIEWSSDGCTFTTTPPTYDVNQSQTLYAVCVADVGGCISERDTVTTAPGSSIPSAPAIAVTDNDCDAGTPGAFTITTACGAGSTIEWSTDNGTTWSTTAPTYDNTSAQTAITRCVDGADATCVSTESAAVTSSPTVCSTCPEPNCFGISIQQN